jgi:hypothetical protein
LAAEIEKALHLEVELEEGKLHSFDVLVGDDLIFSKTEEEHFPRFPEPDEIIALIRAHLSEAATGDADAEEDVTRSSEDSTPQNELDTKTFEH